MPIDKGSSQQFLKELIREEKRSRLLADFETDSAKKMAAMRRAKGFRALIARMRRAANGQVETADALMPMADYPEEAGK